MEIKDLKCSRKLLRQATPGGGQETWLIGQFETKISANNTQGTLLYTIWGNPTSCSTREEKKKRIKLLMSNVFSCISLRAHPPSRVAGIRNVQDGWGGDPSRSYCTILYYTERILLLYYTDAERILLLFYTHTAQILLLYDTILSGSCCTLESQKFLLPPPGFNQRSPHA